MLKNIILGISLLVSGIVSAQDVFQYKGFGQDIIYEFTENTFKAITNGEESSIVKIISTEKNGALIRYSVDSYMGVKTRYSFVKKGKKGKYTMILESVDDFTKQVTTGSLVVTKIK